MTDDTNYIFSVYVQLDNRTEMFLRFVSKAGTSNDAEFSLSGDGSVLSETNVIEASIRKLNDATSTYRVAIKVDSESGGTTPRIEIGAMLSGAKSYAGTSVDSINLHGAQLEESGQTGGSNTVMDITSLVTTGGADGTRSDDLLVASAMTPWFNRFEGTVWMDFEVDHITAGGANPAQTLFELHDGTADDRLLVYIKSGNIHFISRRGGSDEFQITSVAVSAGRHKVCVTYKQNEFKFMLNNGDLTTQTTGELPDGIDELNVGTDYNDTNHLNGFIAFFLALPYVAAEQMMRRLTEPDA